MERPFLFHEAYAYDEVSSTMAMRQTLTISATVFESHCLELLDRVQRAEVQITITKHGKPVARMIPCKDERQPFFGSLPVTIVGDIVSSSDER